MLGVIHLCGGSKPSGRKPQINPFKLALVNGQMIGGLRLSRWSVIENLFITSKIKMGSPWIKPHWKCFQSECSWCHLWGGTPVAPGDPWTLTGWVRMIDQTRRVNQGVFGSVLTFGIDSSVTVAESDKICQVSNILLIFFSASSISEQEIWCVSF